MLKYTFPLPQWPFPLPSSKRGAQPHVERARRQTGGDALPGAPRIGNPRIGHRVDHVEDEAVKLTLACAPRYKIPEPTRLAHTLSREED